MLPPEQVRVLPEREPVKLDSKKAGRVTTRGVFADVFGSFTDITLRPMRTAAALLKRPGKLIRRYLQGNREEISGPGRMAFIGVSLFLILNSLLASDISGMFDPFVWFRNYWPYAAPLILLPASAIQRWLFRSHRMSFGDTYAFGLYMLGQVALFRAALVVVERYTGMLDVYTSSGSLMRDGTIMVIEAAYVAWAASGFYRDRRASVWLRGALSYGAFAAVGYTIVSAVMYYVVRDLFT